MKANKKIKKKDAAVTGATSMLPGLEFMETLDLALKFIFTIVAIMLTGLFFIFIHDYVMQSHYFPITEISVHGLTRLTKAEVLTQAGLNPDDTLLNINTFKIRKRLIAHPWIKTVHISRKPPHTLEILVREEEPLARVAMGTEPPLLINTQGIPFTQCSPESPPDEMNLPLIKGLTLEKRGDRVGFFGLIYQSILSVLTTDFGRPITAVTADNATGIAIETRFLSTSASGQSIEIPTILKLGFSQFKSKFQTAGKIFHYLQQHAMAGPIVTIDLFNPERVIVTPGRQASGADTTGGA